MGPILYVTFHEDLDNVKGVYIDFHWLTDTGLCIINIHQFSEVYFVI